MLRLLLILLTSVSLYAQSITLADLVFIVQKHDKVSIVLASDVPKALKVDFPSVYNQSHYLPLLKSVLTANNLSIVNNDGIYYIRNGEAINPPDSSDLLPPPAMISSAPVYVSDQNNTDFDYSFNSYRLKFLQFDHVRSLLDFSGIPYTFSEVSKTVILKQNHQNKKAVSKLLNQLEAIDIKKDQVTLKVTIFDTNTEKIRAVGINPNINFDFSLLSQTGALLTGDAVASFKGSLKLLSSLGATHVNHSTAYLISDRDKLDFKKVVSLPFLDEDFALTTENGTNQSRKYKYRDVGFIVSATPTIVGDTVYLDFVLSVGSVLSSGDLPTTSENTISNRFSVRKGDIVLLAGISKESLITDSGSAPFIENIPIIGSIFTQKSNTNAQEYFNVSIEIL